MLGAAGSLLTEVVKSGKVAGGVTGPRGSGAARHAVQVRLPPPPRTHTRQRALELDRFVFHPRRRF